LTNERHKPTLPLNGRRIYVAVVNEILNDREAQETVLVDMKTEKTRAGYMNFINLFAVY
jgi:hypothetical protein